MTYQCLDDRLAPDHPARAVLAVVQSLDLSDFLATAAAVEGRAGRDRTDPAVLLALWLYAAVDGVGSARALARLCEQSDPYRWLAGGLSLKYHTLSDFRTGHADALDALFTRSLAALVKQGLVTVARIAQDGTRVRAAAGASSFRRGQTLAKLLAEAEAHVAALRARLDDPAAAAGLSARQRAAQERAARERVERIERAAAAGTAAAAAATAGAAATAVATTAVAGEGAAATVATATAGEGTVAATVAATVTVATATAGEGTVAATVATATVAIAMVVGTAVAGTTTATTTAGEGGVVLYVPPKPPRDPQKYGSQFEPRARDSEAINDWRARMGTEQAKEVYKERAATVETVNADLKVHRNLGRLLVRGVAKARCVALLAALAYNVIHFGAALAAG